MSTAVLLSLLMCGSPTTVTSTLTHTTLQSGLNQNWDVIAPTMDGWTQYNKFDSITNSLFRPVPDWTPMNETGQGPGDLYTPFFDFNGDATMAGWRLDGDPTSEVVFYLKDDSRSLTPNASFTAGQNIGDSSLLTMTGLTFLDAPSGAAGETFSNVSLPFTTHIVWIGKQSTDSFRPDCDQPWNFTATVVTANGTTTFSSAIDRLQVDVPPNISSTITLQNTADPEFLAVLSFSGESSFLYSRGSSSQIGSITLFQELDIAFCPEDD
ncbi:hypothetical protein GGX14DRAFT_385499 [Mycena pura]|uniref:Uncharacterized protein n=1 Tax=Mycena pura TaxID=153505 RepID=A0AAD6YRC2_9AGAR|nr:hypothetical protein GGX14DRAFT_385499 [Mycena pura]